MQNPAWISHKFAGTHSGNTQEKKKSIPCTDLGEGLWTVELTVGRSVSISCEPKWREDKKNKIKLQEKDKKSKICSPQILKVYS